MRRLALGAFTMSMQPTRERIIAPFSGRVMDLSCVPDPVFSEKMTGDGLAILAESEEVLAPCDGEITLFFDTKHAFAVTTSSGIQVLVHIGLDSILLNGQGIVALQAAGQQVAAGTPILKIDLPMLKRKEINMISPVLIVNHEKVADLRLCAVGGKVSAGEDTVMDFVLA